MFLWLADATLPWGTERCDNARRLRKKQGDDASPVDSTWYVHAIDNSHCAEPRNDSIPRQTFRDLKRASTPSRVGFVDVVSNMG